MIFPMVDFGTPLFLYNWYCVIFFSSSNSLRRLLTASFNFKSLTTCFLYDYIVRENKNGPFNCTILTICGMIDTREMFHDYYILWHRELYVVEEVKAWLERVIKELIVNGTVIFYLVEYGTFDRLVAAVLAK